MLKLNLANLQLFALKKVEVLHQDVIHKQRLGAKAADGQTVTDGSILYRGNGTPSTQV